MDEMMKRNESTWTRLVLVELLEERALIGQLGPRHGNVQEAKGGRAVFLILYFD